MKSRARALGLLGIALIAACSQPPDVEAARGALAAVDAPAPGWGADADRVAQGHGLATPDRVDVGSRTVDVFSRAALSDAAGTSGGAIADVFARQPHASAAGVRYGPFVELRSGERRRPELWAEVWAIPEPE